jgi:maltose O-acetyltransferase
MGPSLRPLAEWKRRAEQLMSAASEKRAKFSGCSERLGLRRMVDIAVSEWGDIDFRRLALGIVLAPLPDGAFPRLRAMVHRLLGIRIGRSTLIRGRLKLTGPPGCTSRLTIGSNCFFTTPLHIDLNSDVVIGNQVTIGHDVAIVTSAHLVGGPARRCGNQVPAPIRIGDGCWIGARVLLLPGVVLGDGSIIAAGAVVRSNVEPHTIVGGVPARLIRHLG